MSTWANRIGLALMIGALVAYGSCAADERERLCVNGHPVKRSPHVTYGGLSPLRGFQRDHILSLGLGGPDTPDNVRYEPLAEAHEKDDVEIYLVKSYCAGRIELTEAREAEKKWQQTYKDLYGIWPPHATQPPPP